MPITYPPALVEFDGTNWSPSAFQAGGAIQYFSPLAQASWAGSVIGIGTLLLQRVDLPIQGIFTGIGVHVSNTFSATNAGSSQAQSQSFTIGVYTRNGLSLSLSTSGSFSTAYTVTGSSSSASYQGLKEIPIAVGGIRPLLPNQYWVGYIYSSATAGDAIMAAQSNVIASVPGGQSVFKGYFGSASGVSNVYDLGLGSYSVTSASLPTVIGLSELLSQVGATARPTIVFRGFSN